MLQWIRDYLPLSGWLRTYHRNNLINDAVAGSVVGIMLIPQGMAYAMLAGLPPQFGLYAAILPLLLYALFGSSRSLAVGPVAITSLMAGSTIADASVRNLAEPVTVAIHLSLITAVILLLLRTLRLGVIVNFMSHSVISGFTSAAALLIAASQLRHLVGLDIPRDSPIPEQLLLMLTQFSAINPVTSGIAAVALLTLWWVNTRLPALLRRTTIPGWLAQPVYRAGPLFAMALGIALVSALQLEQQVAIVGSIPAGLPELKLPNLNLPLCQQLLIPATLIALVGFMESVSVATTLASQRRERIDPNKELVALGAANLGAVLSGTYPVAGGFGRSMVNHSAGAETTLASVMSAALVAITLVFLTPVFYYLPNAVLGAVILMAVLPLINIEAFTDSWRFNKADALTLLSTFLGVLTLGVELGLLCGIAISFILLLYRSSQPHIAIVGRIGNSPHFRNIQRHDVNTNREILALRVDESLYFANTRFVEDFIRAQCAAHREVRHVILICTAVNFIDASALESLENLTVHLRSESIALHLAEVKGPVMDQLHNTRFMDHLQPGRIFFSTDEAIRELSADTAEARTG